jgi:hypothetical protein
MELIIALARQLEKRLRIGGALIAAPPTRYRVLQEDAPAEFVKSLDGFPWSVDEALTSAWIHWNEFLVSGSLGHANLFLNVPTADATAVSHKAAGLGLLQGNKVQLYGRPDFGSQHGIPLCIEMVGSRTWVAEILHAHGILNLNL